MSSLKSTIFGLLLCVAAFASGAPAQTSASPYREVRREGLLNGLQIVMLEEGSPRVRCDLIVRAGSMFDLVGKAGLAALTQETLVAVNPRLVAEVESLDGRILWRVDHDAAYFNLEVPARDFETALEILARVLVVETIRQDAFDAAQRARLQLVSPALPVLADEAFNAALYGDHPYGHNVDGTAQTIARIGRGDIYDFHRRFYLANNTVAIVVGGIRPERVLRAFKTLFGGWTKGQPVPPTFRQPARASAPRLVKVDAAESSGYEVRGGVLGPRASDPDFIVAELLARVLEARLRSAGPETIEVRAARRALLGALEVRAAVPEAGAAEFSRRLSAAFAALASTEVTAAELNAARAVLASEYRARPIADELRAIEVYNLPRNYPLAIEGRLAELTAADLRRVARALLEGNALTLLVLGRNARGFEAQM